MGEWFPLDTAAGPVRAWFAQPTTRPRGAVILLQEIFGVNAHIRAVADGFARDGLVVIAPSLFDPVQPQVELGYGEEDFARGRELRCGETNSHHFTNSRILPNRANKWTSSRVCSSIPGRTVTVVPAAARRAAATLSPAL